MGWRVEASAHDVPWGVATMVSFSLSDWLIARTNVGMRVVVVGVGVGWGGQAEGHLQNDTMIQYRSSSRKRERPVWEDTIFDMLLLYSQQLSGLVK